MKISKLYSLLVIVLISTFFAAVAYAVPPGNYKCPDIGTVNTLIGPAVILGPMELTWPIKAVKFNNINFHSTYGPVVDSTDTSLTLTATGFTKVWLAHGSGYTSMSCEYSAFISNNTNANIFIGSDSGQDFTHCQVEGNVVKCN